MGAEWTDVSTRLDALATALPVGELVLAPGMSLFDAMISIELGAPKMDSGLVTDHDRMVPVHDPLFVLDSTRTLSATDAVRTLAHLLRATTTFVSGAGTLANTLFTSAHVRLHAHLPPPSSDSDGSPGSVVRAVVRAALRSSLHLVTVVQMVGIYEEEDFCSDRGTLDLLDHVDDATVLDDLAHARDWLDRARSSGPADATVVDDPSLASPSSSSSGKSKSSAKHHKHNKGGAGKKQPKRSSNGNGSNSVGNPFLDALALFVQFHSLWLQVTRSLATATWMGDLPGALNRLAQLARDLFKSLGSLSETLPSAAPAPTSATAASVTDAATAQELWSLGFNPRALRHQNVYSPPREVPWLDYSACLDEWCHLLDQLASAARLNATAPDFTPAGLFSLMEHARTHWRAFPRICLHVRLFPTTGMTILGPLRDILRQWVKADVNPPFMDSQELPIVVRAGLRSTLASSLGTSSLSALAANAASAALEAECIAQAQEIIGLFIETLFPIVWDAVRALACNPGRARRLLCKVVRQLDLMEKSTDQLDVELGRSMGEAEKPYYLLTFIHQLKTRWLLDTMESGVMLDIYSERERNALLIYQHCILDDRVKILIRQAKCRIFGERRLAYAMHASGVVSSRDQSPAIRRRKAGPPSRIPTTAPPPTWAAIPEPTVLDPLLRWTSVKLHLVTAAELVHLLAHPMPIEPAVQTQPQGGGIGYGLHLQYQQRFRFLRSLTMGPPPLKWSTVLETAAAVHTDPIATIMTAQDHLDYATALVRDVEPFATVGDSVVARVLGDGTIRAAIVDPIASCLKSYAAIEGVLNSAPSHPTSASSSSKGGKAKGKGKKKAAAASATAAGTGAALLPPNTAGWSFDYRHGVPYPSLLPVAMGPK
ncbi:Mak10 subunit, NatC N-terminal acetyltransferase-domain-containing protein [Blastocladiella britannica]|nr:Mak10 subunit, NatC N-terminal acetyltransferase-domain-containing protein [Blastocladiella britannica]